MLRNLIVSLLMAVCWAGCSRPDATVQGTVTIDGEIAHQGTVQFHPVEGGPTAYGSIAENGAYSLRVGKADLDDPAAGGLQSGEYLVTVVVNMPSHAEETVGETGPPKPGARLSAEKYSEKSTTDLRATVKPGLNIVPLELEGTVAEAVVAEEVEETDADTTTEGDAATPTTDSAEAAPAADSTGEAATEPATAGAEATQ